MLYCYQDDELEDATRRMREQRVYRLVVLDKPENSTFLEIIRNADSRFADNTYTEHWGIG